MKIAVLASGSGEKALHIYDFFKEGNRVTVDCLLTDSLSHPVARRMEEEGVVVIEIPEGELPAGLAQKLKEGGVEMVVVDGYSRETPEELKEVFGNAILSPSSAANAPLEIIEKAKKRDAALSPESNARLSEPSPKRKSEEENSLEKEWADALNVDLDAAELSEGENEKALEPPRYEESNPESVRPPRYEESDRQAYYRNNTPPGYQQSAEAPQQPSEPMPNTYLVWSVIITIVCCLIPGVIAIIYSASVSSKYYKGNIEGAKRASRYAQIWCIVSIISGIVWATLYLPLSLFLG